MSAGTRTQPELWPAVVADVRSHTHCFEACIFAPGLGCQMCTSSGRGGRGMACRLAACLTWMQRGRVLVGGNTGEGAMKEYRVQMGKSGWSRYMYMWAWILTRQNRLPCKQSGKLTLTNFVWKAFVGTCDRSVLCRVMSMLGRYVTENSGFLAVLSVIYLDKNTCKWQHEVGWKPCNCLLNQVIIRGKISLAAER